MCSSVTLCVQASQHYQSCHGSVVAQGASTAIFTLCLARAFHNESVKIYMCCEHSLTQNNILFTLPVTVVNCTRGHSPADLANGRRASLCPSQNQNIMPQITPARLLGSVLSNITKARRAQGKRTRERAKILRGTNPFRCSMRSVLDHLSARTRYVMRRSPPAAPST